MKTSIVMTALNKNNLQTNITSAAIGNISKYTDREDYELILIDQRTPDMNKIPDLNCRHNAIVLDKHIKIDHIGMSAAMNKGFKESNPDYPYICFIHNDVFVWEGWLKTMREMIEKDSTAIIMPTQGPYKRKDILEFNKQENPVGNDDAGIVMMTKETFKKTGGWDERFKGVFQDAAFRLRFPKHYFCTGKVIITHIGAINLFTDEEYAKEDPIWMELKNYGTGKNINYL